MAFFPLYFIMDSGYTNEVSVYKLYLLGLTGERSTGRPSQSRSAGVTAPRQRHALSGASRQLPQRGSHWRAGPLCAGRLKPDRTQKSGPRLRGQRLLDKSTLSSCCGARPQGTTVSGQRKLCSSRVGLTGTPVPLPLGEVSPKVTEKGYCQRCSQKIETRGIKR